MTQAASGSAIALNYGFNWITGFRLNYRTLQNTNNDHLDYTRGGMWALGEGEMDGCEELWDSALQRLLYTSENDDTTAFRFHSGSDAVIGSGTAPVSTGGDQGIDTFWNFLPSGVEPLNYNRIAYYSLFLKLVVNNPPGPVHQNDPNAWVDLNPVGLWRGIRCRFFDATGAMTGYGFTTNPAWQIVDILLRRRLYPEYNIVTNVGADDLTTAVRNRFDWPSIAAAAYAYDLIMPTGQRQFEGNFSFSQQSTLQACVTQMLQACRSYMLERSGKIALYLDQERDSVFTLSRKNTNTFSTNDSSLNSAANRFVAKFRDVQVPSAADVVSITVAGGVTTVTTLNPHPFALTDRLIFGGTGTKYDGIWVVDSVPAGDSITTFTLRTKGSNYPTDVGAGGKVGLTYSRFKDRAPEFNHHAHQYAKGTIGVGIPRQRNKVKLETDFATSTYDQASRISQYQKVRTLGVDSYAGQVRPPDTIYQVQPLLYVPPVFAEAELPVFAADQAGSGNLAVGIEPGDRVTVDDTLDPEYAGEFEVLTAVVDLVGSTPGTGSSIRRSPVAGKVTLTLGPYSENAFSGLSDQTQAGWETVPGSEPGNAGNFTSIPLADGVAAFFSGSLPDGATISIPSVGFSSTDTMFWVGPQGFIDANGDQLHFIQTCTVDPTRLVHLIYDNGNGNTWRGDLNFAGLAWRTNRSAAVTSNAGFTFVELTLLGGEKICFGSGRVNASTAVVIPAGYTAAQSIMLAFPNSAADTGNNSHGVRSFVDTAGIAHHDYYDGSGNHWEGDSNVFFFGYKNNMGTVTTESGGWIKIPVGSSNLILGGFTVVDARVGSSPSPNPSTSALTPVTGTLPTPTGVAATTTLQVILSPDSFQIVDHPAHGVKECLVDAGLNVLTSFQDGDGNEWYGSAAVFALVCDSATV